MSTLNVFENIYYQNNTTEKAKIPNNNQHTSLKGLLQPSESLDIPTVMLKIAGQPVLAGIISFRLA